MNHKPYEQTIGQIGGCRDDWYAYGASSCGYQYYPNGEAIFDSQVMTHLQSACMWDECHYKYCSDLYPMLTHTHAIMLYGDYRTLYQFNSVMAMLVNLFAGFLLCVPHSRRHVLEGSV